VGGLTAPQMLDAAAIDAAGWFGVRSQLDEEAAIGAGLMIEVVKGAIGGA
jgi:hypothetical protein